MKHLELIFEKLGFLRVVMNAANGESGIESLTYLGRSVSVNDIQPTDEQVKDVCQFSQPQSLNKLRVDFCRLFLTIVAITLSCLTHLLASL